MGLGFTHYVIFKTITSVWCYVSGIMASCLSVSLSGVVEFDCQLLMDNSRHNDEFIRFFCEVYCFELELIVQTTAQAVCYSN